MTIDFNINEYVSVQLTDEGRAIHRQNFVRLASEFPHANLKYTAPKEDNNGWSKWQGWELMREFGPFMHLGLPQPFGAEIKIHLGEKL